MRRAAVQALGRVGGEEGICESFSKTSSTSEGFFYHPGIEHETILINLRSQLWDRASAGDCCVKQPIGLALLVVRPKKVEVCSNMYGRRSTL